MFSIVLPALSEYYICLLITCIVIIYKWLKSLTDIYKSLFATLVLERYISSIWIQVNFGQVIIQWNPF